MAKFTFPTNPSNNQIVESPIGQRFIFVSVDDGWRSLGPAKSPAGSAGVAIDATMFFIHVPVAIALSAASEGTGNGINPPFSFILTSGNLPSGLALTSNGLLSGTPLYDNEQYSFTISVLDSLSFLVNTIIFSGTVSTNLTAAALTSYATLYSPNFTGVPTTPTPTVGDHTKRIANTAFVTTAISNAISSYNISGITSLQSTVDGMRASISEIQTISSTNTSSIASLNTSLSAISGLNSLHASLNSEIIARVGADSAMAGQIATMTAIADQNTAAINTEMSVRATAIDAIATSLTTLTATVGDNTAAIDIHSSASADAVTSLANTISSLTTTVANNSSAITTESTTRSDQYTATANSISVLSATVGNHTSSIATNSTAIATLDGYVSAAYGVTLDVNNYITGFQVVNGGSPASSSFIVRADLFEVIGPGGSAAEPLFSVSDIGGVNTISITGNIIQNGVETLTLTFAPQTTWYVNFASGSDTTGNGKTTGTAWATIQHAIAFISSHFIYAGTITIQCADGTFTVPPGENWAAIFTNAQIATWYLQGNISSPSSCIIDASGYACRGITNAGVATVRVTGFTIKSFGEALVSDGGGRLYAGNIKLIGVGTSSSKTIGFAAYGNSSINFVDGAVINISGSYAACFSAGDGGLIQIGWSDGLGGTSYVTLNLTSPHWYVSCMSVDNATINFDTATVVISGAATGSSYAINQGRINTYGTGAGAIPGSGTGSNVNYGVFS